MGMLSRGTIRFCSCGKECCILRYQRREWGETSPTNTTLDAKLSSIPSPWVPRGWAWNFTVCLMASVPDDPSTRRPAYCCCHSGKGQNNGRGTKYPRIDLLKQARREWSRYDPRSPFEARGHRLRSSMVVIVCAAGRTISQSSVTSDVDQGPWWGAKRGID